MQNAKDTFYATLESRLAALNPARTMVVRGVVRPATLVDENELPSALVPLDAFRLQWTRLQVNSSASLPWIAMECTIHYATDGTSGAGGMDRGRALAAMDTELRAALASEPHAVPKLDYTSGTPVERSTNIFWADPVFDSVVTTGERLARIATVQVFSYQEAGEL